MNYKTTRTYACSFCNESGHNINKCQSEEIIKLDRKIKQIGLFDIILFVFSSLHLDENITLLTSELNKLSNAEKKVLFILNREKSQASEGDGESMFHKLYKIYYLNNITDYLNNALNQPTSILFDEILHEIRNFPKQKFVECATQILQIYLNHEQLPHELQKIYQTLYPTEKKAPIEFLYNETTTTATTTQECPICYDEIAPSEQMKTNCQHIYCAPCVNQFLYQETSRQRQQIKVCCPMCRTEITSLETQNQETKNKLQEKYCSKQQQQPQQEQLQEEQQLQNMYTMVATLIGF